MSALFAIWALVASGFTAVTLWRLSRASRGVVADAPPPTLLIRPVDRPTPLELENLAAPLPLAVMQVVVSPSREHLSPGLRWVHSDPHCANRKVGHVLAALAAFGVDGRRVAVVDADVRVDAALLSSLAAPLRQGAAMATAAPLPEVRAGLAARALRGILAHGHHHFVALDAMSVGAKPACGKAMMLGPAALSELPALAHFLGEDLELARRLHARGERVALARAVARVPQPVDLPLRTVIDRMTRWMQVLRAHRPALFPSVPLLFAPTPLLLLVAASLRTPALIASTSVLVGLRTALALRLRPRASESWEWLLGECVLMVAAVRGLLRRRVVWRGRTYRIAAGGRIAEDA